MFTRFMAFGLVGLAVSVLVAAAGDPDEATAKSLVGKYKLAGSTIKGEKYDGKVEIVLDSGATVKFTYTFADDYQETGLGVVKKDTLTIKHFQQVKGGKKAGAAVFKINPDGTLEGTYHHEGSKAAQKEKLIPQKK